MGGPRSRLESSLARVQAISKSKRTEALLGGRTNHPSRTAVGAALGGPKQSRTASGRTWTSELESSSVKRQTWIVKSPLSKGSNGWREVRMR